MNFIIKFFILLFFISCEKDEIPINPHQSGKINTEQVGMGANYRYQVFYNLKNNNITSTNLKNDWDLGFESQKKGWRVIINSSLFSKISIVENTDFEDVTSSVNLNWNYDNPSGNLDSTAIGDYRDKNNVYVLDRGYSLSGNPVGYKKLRIDSVTSDYYKIKYANLDNTNLQEIKIYKNNNLNFTSFSFKNDSLASFEPFFENWDLVFTQYTHLFEDGTAYLVTGVLSNYIQNTEVAIDSLNNFFDINYQMVENYIFSSKKDKIGYNWKEYDLDNGQYTVFSNISYIVKTQENRFFKLRFIDFYNNLGETGYPTFEVQEL